ncbi:ATP-binding cassette domain-containing protein [Acidilutibacter cellobiosedens]|uniref:ATP-binding cassette domain-containing protein n=1 Tax=Acidilutibacter cellobiosedens TaxID=2507161 RepID=A0A410QHQ8_9FIRM|nr:ATP-binding cassette domain-containing protein [Acidilutibacter cellobiosedens]
MDNFTYKFEKNKKYAIVREGGCDKIILIKLILDYYDNYDGEIMIDENEIRTVNQSSIVRLISTIHQNIYV